MFSFVERFLLSCILYFPFEIVMNARFCPMIDSLKHVGPQKEKTSQINMSVSLFRTKVPVWYNDILFANV